MAHLLTENQTKLFDEIRRRQNAHAIDIQRLWRRIQQLEQVIVNTGLSLPAEEE